jgi:enediyne biosynthesis protein E4
VSRLGASLVVSGVAVLVAIASVGAEAGVASKAFEVSRQVGIHEITHTHGALVFDYDEDGWDDVLINRHYEAFPRLYRNQEGTFTDVTDQAIPESERMLEDPHGCAAADVDVDGLVDVYCTVGGREGGLEGDDPNPKMLWIQQLDGTFVASADEYRVEDPWGRGREPAFLDANGDRYPDLYVANISPRIDDHRTPSRLFINVRGQRFRNAPRYGVNGEKDETSAQAIDYDGDGREDLLVCGAHGATLYRNIANSRFRDVSAEVGLGEPCRDTELVRIDGDGRPDLVTTAEGGLSVRIQGSRRFRRPAFKLGTPGALTFAIGEVTGDGRNDIYLLRSGPRAGADRSDRMLVSRGGGRRFKTMSIPQTHRGVGEAVTPIDYDRNGLTDFIVQNGRYNNRGPIRLIAFRRN